jgi:hypothetical protein
MGLPEYFRSTSIEQRKIAAPPETSSDLAPFIVHVVFTSWQGTLGSLQHASQMSRSLGAKIVLWYFQNVPRQFAASQAPVSTHFLKRRLCAMARKCCHRTDVEIRIYACTDPDRCMKSSLLAGSVVLIHGRKRWWWPTPEQKAASALESNGCRVLFDGGRL